MDALLAMLDQDCAGRENALLLLLNQAPKYGNDHEEVDEIARALVTRILTEFKPYRNPRGGRYEPGRFGLDAFRRDMVCCTKRGGRRPCGLGGERPRGLLLS